MHFGCCDWCAARAQTNFSRGVLETSSHLGLAMRNILPVIIEIHQLHHYEYMYEARPSKRLHA